MKNRYFIELAFVGTNYSGWQKQKNGVSVQQVINEKLSLKLNEKIEVTGAGRTDAGVHAEYFVAHIDTDVEIKEDFIQDMNKFLPNDITFKSIKKVKDGVHARFSAITRTYQYRISTKKNPFLWNFTHYYYGKLNIEKMNKAASILINVSDFTSFSKLHGNSKTNICKVFKAEWAKKNDLILFTITANRFLRNMVRAIVGTLLEVGKEKISVKDFEKIIGAKDRCKASSSAPAKGLFLTSIEYPEDIYDLLNTKKII